MDLHVPTTSVRFVTAASLFDGHDAAINVMRRILQSQGAEVVHLGHDRSVDAVVTAAVQEDVQGVALSSYQGGHVEYFTYLKERLAEVGAGHVQVFGGGGGVIVADEIALLADMAMKTEASRQLVYVAAAKADRGAPDLTFASAAAKCFASDTAMQVAVDAVQLFGGAGYTTDFPVERYMRDAKITQIYEGTNQIQRVVMARSLLR